MNMTMQDTPRHGRSIRLAISVLALGGLALLGLSACSRSGVNKQATLERILALPLCNELERPAEVFDALDCRLDPDGTRDPTDVKLLFSYAPVEAGANTGDITMRLAKLDGTELQALTEADVPMYLYPYLEDFDGDGALDVILPREVGNVNTVMALLKRQKEGQQYTRFGEINGVGFQRTAEGYLAVQARSSAASWGVSFYDVTGPALVPLALIQIAASETGEGGAVTATKCTLEDISAAALATQTPEAAQAKFCGDPAADVYKE